MNFIDLPSQYKKIKQDVEQAMQAVLEHGRYLMGPEVTELETQLAKYVGASHCIGAASGTMALQIALMALEIKPGDEVITTPFTFIAPVEMILLMGAKPVFVDIDPETYLMNPELLEAAITDKTKAILPVSLYGQCASLPEINQIAAKYNLPVIEDAAQSFGAKVGEQYSCGMTTIACTSFYPSKPLGCYGDGGACFTSDDALAEKMRLIINHGQTGRYQHSLAGLTGRLASLQAAVLLQKLTIFDEEMRARQQVANWYQEALRAPIKAPYVKPGCVSAYAQYTVRVAQREQVMQQLSEAGVPTMIHYPSALHQQPLFADTAYATQSFPEAERAGETVLCLPFNPYLTEKEVHQVADALQACEVLACE